jgi:hypothetical protein
MDVLKSKIHLVRQTLKKGLLFQSGYRHESQFAYPEKIKNKFCHFLLFCCIPTEEYSAPGTCTFPIYAHGTLMTEQIGEY